MAKFKVGDKVKRIEAPTRNIKVGEEGIIKCYSNSSYFKLEDKGDETFFEDFFKLVESTPKKHRFKVGDKITGLKGNPGEYGVTIYGVGYGIVSKLLENGFNNKDIEVRWFSNWRVDGGYSVFEVNSEYFELMDSMIKEELRIEKGLKKLEKGETMELNEIKKENLSIAKEKFDTERNNAEVEFALQQLRHATDQINKYDAEIQKCLEYKKPYEEVLAKFSKKVKQ